MIGLNITVNAGNVIEEIGKDIDRIEQELAYRIVEEARALMDSSTPSGRLYRKGSFRRGQSKGLNTGLGRRARGPGMRIHRASAPGQPPAEDTGRLYRDMSVKRMASGRYRIRFGAPYAGYLEFNLNRPFVLPAIERAVEKTFR